MVYCHYTFYFRENNGVIVSTDIEARCVQFGVMIVVKCTY